MINSILPVFAQPTTTQRMIVVGLQWGDEGKGKIIDFLSSHVQAIVRFQGGHNAGHTIMVDGQQLVLHLLPSGILHAGKKNYLGNGVVVSPIALVQELVKLEGLGVPVAERLLISATCSLLFPSHALLDQQQERFLAGKAIGTTGRGIGPAYTDKTARIGLRAADLLSPNTLLSKFQQLFNYHCWLLEHYYHTTSPSFDSMVEPLLQAAEILQPLIIDLPLALFQHLQNGDNILFEGAQGTFLDLDHGTYPYVTASNTVAAAAATGTGLGPLYFNHVLGIAKAYTTRVGAGPFPTELHDATASWFVQHGQEFGATTHRQRRCGWLDLPLLRRAIILNSVSTLALTKLDILSGLLRLKLCVAYRLHGVIIEIAPSNSQELAYCEPIYEELTGWSEAITGCTSWAKLPAAAQAYVQRVATLLQIKIALLATGQERAALIILEHQLMGIDEIS